MTHLYAAKMQGGWNNVPKRTVLDEESEFYDLTDDPYEMNQLAKTDRQRDTAAALRAELFAWDAETPWLNERVAQP